jgi:hypothetical protein
MPYAHGRTYHDADSHLMDFANRAEYADAAIRDHTVLCT